jgi:hypothetical protein
MHASIDHLLSLRDGQPVDAATAAHVEQCPRCAAELYKLRETRAKLQSLPLLDAPSSFQEIQRAMARPAPTPRRVMSARLVAAMAFVTLTTIFFVALRDETAPQTAGEGAQQAELPAPAAANPVEPVRLPELVAQSQRLDDLLQQLPERPRVERVSTAATIDTIEERIQWLDFQLSDAGGLNEAQMRRLWRERVDLMDSLVKVRYAEGGVTF